MQNSGILKKTKDNNGIMGMVTFRNFVIDSERAKEIDNELQKRNISKERYFELVTELEKICKVKKVTKKNLVVLSGRSIFARLLVGDTTYSGEVTHGALGDDNTAVNASDTTLVNEVARKPYAVRSRTNAQVSLDFYYSKSDTDGTYEEFGLFIDGTATADSGQLFNRVLTGGWNKSSSEAMTVSIQIDINAA